MAPVINTNKRKDFPSSSSESNKERKRKSRKKGHEDLLLSALQAKVLVFLQDESTFNSITLRSMDNSDLSHNVFKQISSSPASRKDLIDLHGFTSSRRGIAKCQHHYDEEFRRWGSRRANVVTSLLQFVYSDLFPQYLDIFTSNQGLSWINNLTSATVAYRLRQYRVKCKLYHPKNWRYFDVDYDKTTQKLCDTAEGNDGSQNVEDRKFFHDILKKTKDVCVTSSRKQTGHGRFQAPVRTFW